MSTTSVFGNFVSTAQVSRELPIGVHNVKLISALRTNSFLNNDGSEKPLKDRPEWSDTTPQVIVKFMEPEKKLFHTHRIQFGAYRKSNTITKLEIKSGLIEVVGDYLVDKTTKKRLTDGDFQADGSVLPVDSGLARCMRICNDFFNALGIDEGTNDVTPAIADGRLITITIMNKEYHSEEQKRISSFKKYYSSIMTDAPEVPFEG